MMLLKHILLWGSLGILMEVLFTGFRNVLKGQFHATGQSYLWMYPIYGLGGIALESVRALVHHSTVVGAIFSYTILIYVFEYTSGWLLRKLIGKCPWDYSDARYHLHGLIRWDYLPYWMVVAGLWDVTSTYFLKLLTI